MGTYIRKQTLVGAGGRLVARNTVPATAPVKRVSPDPVLFDGNDYMLVVSNTADSCRRRRHVLERVTGILVTLDGKPCAWEWTSAKVVERLGLGAKIVHARPKETLFD